MKLLRLATTLNSTSAPYNQFSLGLKKDIDQTFLSLLKNEIKVDKAISYLSAEGSIYKMFKLLRKQINSNKYDIIHIHSGLTGLIFLFSIFPFKLFLLKKTIFTLHNSWHVLKFRNQLLDLLIIFLVKKVCTCGISCKKSLPTLFELLVGKKIIAVVNGFDNERIDFIENSKTKDQHFNSETKIKIVCVGALNDTKNQIAILEALKKIQMKCEVVFLGDGNKKNSLINFSKSISDKTKIIFKGKVSRKIAIEHMLEADISISLSKGEGLPIAVLESMYAGCYNILSSIPPHNEISPPKERCFFVNLSNKLEIIDSLMYVKENINDIKKNRSKSKSYSINNFGLKKMLKEYVQLYDSIL